MKVNFKIKIFEDNEWEKNLIYYHLEFTVTWRKKHTRSIEPICSK